MIRSKWFLLSLFACVCFGSIASFGCSDDEAYNLATQSVLAVVNSTTAHPYHVEGQPSETIGGNFWDFTISVSQGIGGKEYRVVVSGTPVTSCEVSQLQFIADLR